MSTESPVGVFIDTENLTQWIKLGGLETLLEELSSIGPVVVRKAYGRWTNPSLAAHQGTLNRLGFELVHTFHPVSGKNSADIQITVDVMEYAWRESDLGCITLATGDSDFSPLFRRLREMGKQVIGAGPRSALSESVKSSCSRFFYTKTELDTTTKDIATRVSAFDDAADLLESALKTFDGPANCSALKNRMLNIDSAFDEKELGFKSFTDFVKAVDSVDLENEDKTWYAFFRDDKTAQSLFNSTKKASEPEQKETDLSEQYRRILRKKHWRSIPTSTLIKCHEEMKSLDALPRPEIPESAVAQSDGQITTTDIRKAMALFFKSGHMLQAGSNDEGDTLWKVKEHSIDDVLKAIDLGMLIRLLAGLEDETRSLDVNYVEELLLTKRSHKEINELISEAQLANRNTNVEDQ